MARTDTIAEIRLEMARPRKVLSENGLVVGLVLGFVVVVVVAAIGASPCCWSLLAPVNFLTPKTEREVEKRVKKNPNTITAATLSTSTEDPRD